MKNTNNFAKAILFSIFFTTFYNGGLYIIFLEGQWIISTFTKSSIITGLYMSTVNIPYLLGFLIGLSIDLIKNKRRFVTLFLLLYLSFVIASLMTLSRGYMYFLTLFLTISIIIGYTAWYGLSTILRLWVKGHLESKEYTKYLSVTNIIGAVFTTLIQVLAGILLTFFILDAFIIPLCISTLFLLGTLFFFPNPEEVSMNRRGFKEEFKDGIYYIKRNSALRQILLLSSDELFFGMFSILILFYAEDVLKVNAFYYNFMLAVLSAGNILGYLTSTLIKKGKWGLYNTIFSGILTVLIFSFIFIHTYFLSLLPLLGIAYLGGINTILSSSITMRIIPQDIWGRVSGMLTTVTLGFMMLSKPLGGLLIEEIGIKGAFLVVVTARAIYTIIRPFLKDWYNLTIE